MRLMSRECLRVNSRMRPATSGSPLLDIGGKTVEAHSASSPPPGAHLQPHARPVRQGERVVEKPLRIPQVLAGAAAVHRAGDPQEYARRT